MRPLIGDFDIKKKLKLVDFFFLFEAHTSVSCRFLLLRYVAWNVHEPERGMFVFQDQLDLR